MNKKFKHYDIELRKNSKEFIAMESLLSELNSYGFHTDNFLAALSVELKTIPVDSLGRQQTFFRLIQSIILYMAEPDNVCIDDRNRASYEMCRKIADTVRECHLPHI